MSSAVLNAGKQKRRLRRILLLFFLILSIPVYYLLQTVYSQLENEAYFTNRQQAETLVNQIEFNLKHLLEAEQNRPIAEYQFFNVMTNPLLSESSGVKFSPLSEIPPKTDIKGLVGYFQINTDGSFHLPVLPEVGQDNLSGLSLAELESRVKLKKKIRSLLSIPVAEKKQLNKNLPSIAEEQRPEAEALASSPLYRDEFEQKAISKADNMASFIKSRMLKKQAAESINSIKPKMKSAALQKYKTRKETVQLPDQAMASSYFNRGQQQLFVKETKQKEERLDLNDEITTSPPSTSIINVLSFESEVTPLQLLLIGQEYFCFYRYVWHDNKRYTQGFIVNSAKFLEAVTGPLIKSSAFSSLIFSSQNNVLHQIKISQTQQDFELYKRQLAIPFQKLELIVHATKIDDVPGALLIDLITLSLFGIFFIGFIAFYRLGSQQIDLANQQQNFISAVSHELKTPLTSIRMYGEMLRSGWVADEAKKQSYYDFIFFESERLSRLIVNVLQLARLGRQQYEMSIVPVSVGRLLNRVAAKIELQIEASRFKLNIIPPASQAESVEIKVDEDAFFQIVINLVDNAIKFTDKSACKQIDIGFKISEDSKSVVFFIRDYGPGIKKAQMKKIFTLFYRSEDELTRTTPGTGIGLALVKQLAEAMQAQCDVENHHSGAEFRVKFSQV